MMLSVFGIALGASFTTAPDINRISGSDDNIVAAARGNMTGIGWNEEVSSSGAIEMDQINFTVGNEDLFASHIFQICAVVEGPIAIYSSDVGTTPDCVTTPSIPSSGNLTGQIISFGKAINVTDIIDFSFSMEELE